MSRRFGRNQRRKLREENARLLTENRYLARVASDRRLAAEIQKSRVIEDVRDTMLRRALLELQKIGMREMYTAPVQTFGLGPDAQLMPSKIFRRFQVKIPAFARTFDIEED